MSIPKKVRVRFAPSPTGALHIGGVRTALYNYLFARQNGGDFILRIEDTDQGRYVPGAEDYIVRSLEWAGLSPDESPQKGGPHGPYRQSERMSIYKQYAEELLEKGFAYYAFDTAEELDTKRKADPAFRYDASSRLSLKNSLSLSPEETQTLLNSGQNVVIRMKIDSGQTIHIRDEIRGDVSFQSDELDDKVILKGDGMPTYHLANIVDDHLMEISHVIRGEEWLPSTAHHVLLYRYFNWTAPVFAHLPLILKPTGQGKLSKRDGAIFGFPVFPLDWQAEDGLYKGFRETGFLPEAVINFLGLIGWSPGNDQEIFSIEDFINHFSLERIHKAGARFDYDKAKWFNQHYIIHSQNEDLAHYIQNDVEQKFGASFTPEYIAGVCGLMKERVHLLPEIWEKGYFFFTEISEHDLETAKQKWNHETANHLHHISKMVQADIESCETTIKLYIKEQNLKMGEILPLLRIAVSGTVQGPDLFGTIRLLGIEKVTERIAGLTDRMA